MVMSLEICNECTLLDSMAKGTIFDKKSGGDRHFVASTSIGQDSRVFWTSTPKSTDVLVCYELLGSFVDPVSRVMFRLLDVGWRWSSRLER